MRRIHVPALSMGILQLSDAQAHHLRDVLRLKAGEHVQAFDDAGNTASATISQISTSLVSLQIDSIESSAKQFHLTIAAAVPKAARADWMIEKLSELGVDCFIPLATERSVALPQGEGKLGRWNRLATEAAKQSRRAGVMRIEPLTKLSDVILGHDSQTIWHLSTDPTSKPLHQLASNLPKALTLLIGPEGGWTDQETQLFSTNQITAAHLTDTILRIETAAIAAAAVIASIAAKPIT